MRTVHKFPLVNGQPIRIPTGFIPHLVADQLGTPCAWVELDTEAPQMLYEIHKAATGERLHPHGIHLGTLLESHGQFVWHYFAIPVPWPV